MRDNFTLILVFVFIVFSVKSQTKTEHPKRIFEQNVKTDTSTINLLNKISEEKSRNDPDSSLIYAQKALLNAEITSYNIGILHSYKNIATAYYFKGLYNLAIDFFQKALLIAKEENNQKELSEIYNDIGVTYRILGFYNKALTYYYKALKIAEDTKDDFNISNSLNNIAIVYKKQGLNDKALQYYKESLKMAIKIGDEFGTLITYNNIGVLYKKLENYDKATVCFLKALSIAKKLKAHKYIADCYLDIGEIYFAKKSYKTANDYYFKSLKIKQDIGEKKGISKLYNSISLLYLEKYRSSKNKNNLEEAILFGEKSYNLAEEIKALQLIKSSSKTLIDIYKEKGKLNKALFYSEKYILINDSINDIDKTKALTEIGIKYETEKKELENISLKKENQNQKKNQNLLISFVIIIVLLFFTFLIIILKWQKKKNNLYKILKDKNNKLTKIEEELKNSNEELKHLYEDAQTQKEIIQLQNKALKYSESHFRLAQEAGEIGTWEWDVLTDEVTWSKKTYEIFGLTKTFKKVTNEMFFNYVHPEDKQRLIDDLDNAVKSKKVKYRIEYRIIVNSKVLWVVDTSRIILDNNGKLIKKIGVIQDITERNRIVKIIEENNQKQKILINNIPVHIYFKDKDLRYVLVNNSYAKLFNLSVEEIIGKTDDEIISSDISTFYQRLDKQVIRSGKPIIDLQREHIDLSGKKYWAKTSKMPYFNKNSKVSGVIGIVDDITKQVESERKIRLQTEILKNAHKDITDSISYAKTIQQALLPNKNIVDKYLKEYFILYKPKETVSGDFYYLSEKDNHLIFAVADCTGHGVPGGFLTMLGITYLNDIIKRHETDNVGEALNLLRERVKSTFKMYGSDNTNGLDIALCAINIENNMLQYAGAFNPLWIIRGGKLIEYRATRNPIGLYFNELDFETNNIQLQENDLIYLFSDGFQDQLGGLDNKKFLVKRFRKLLIDIQKFPLKEQETILNKTLKDWQKHNEQVDDITIMGVRWKISK